MSETGFFGSLEPFGVMGKKGAITSITGLRNRGSERVEVQRRVRMPKIRTKMNATSPGLMLFRNR
jgi:hypothetical protein